MPRRAARVLGPYPNGAGFRLVLLDGACRKSVTAPTLAAARALKQTLAGELARQQAPTVSAALSEYVAHRVEEGISGLTATEIGRLAQGFLPPDAAMSAITPQLAARLYRALTERTSPRGTPLSPSTHHVLLGRARAFFRWARARGYVPADPFADVRPRGHKRAGKTQLTLDEARRFRALALTQALEGDVAALGVLLLLLLGLRAGEVLARQARDVDDGGRILWITRGKTRNARRRLEVPGELQGPLRRLAADQPPGAPIFGTSRAGGPRNKAFLWFKVQALCRAAGVPRVSAHSLRGLHATLALEAGATPQLVAAALGHGSFRVTARHYAEPSTLLNTRARRATRTLTDGDAPAAPDTDLRALLESLSTAQRAALRRLLGDPPASD